MKYKVAELEGELLDKAVAIALGCHWGFNKRGFAGWACKSINPEEGFATAEDWDHVWIDPDTPEFSTDWRHGGPIIERGRITIGAPGFMKSGLWEAFIEPILDVREDDIVGRFEGYGSTPLIAAMRCYVASKYGDTIELP